MKSNECEWGCSLIEPIHGLSFQSLFDSMAEAMILVEEGGHIVLANPAAQELFSYSEEDICKLTVEALIPTCYRENHQIYRNSYNQKPDKRSMSAGK